MIPKNGCGGGCGCGGVFVLDVFVVVVSASVNDSKKWMWWCVILCVSWLGVSRVTY